MTHLLRLKPVLSDLLHQKLDRPGTLTSDMGSKFTAILWLPMPSFSASAKAYALVFVNPFVELVLIERF